jgi:threonine dehydratase
MDVNDMMLARERLQPYIAASPLIYSNLLSAKFNKHIWLKLETQTPTGSFKVRPAFNSILIQLEEAKINGVIASSSGNFAQGVAYAARELGISVMIVMAENTSHYKQERTKALGAEIILCGNTYEERYDATHRLAKETGRLLLHSCNSNETIAGDGTIGLELVEQLGEKLNQDMTVLVPVSGGGLLAGIACALKNSNMNCKTVGVQPLANASLAKSLQISQCVNVGVVETVADALTLACIGDIAFEIIRTCVDDVILVSEKDILLATRYFIDEHKLVVEHGGAVVLAALLAGSVTTENVVCVVSGGNIELKM